MTESYSGIKYSKALFSFNCNFVSTKFLLHAANRLSQSPPYTINYGRNAVEKLQYNVKYLLRRRNSIFILISGDKSVLGVIRVDNCKMETLSSSKILARIIIFSRIHLYSL